ncbi:type II and III secretion system protein family protein [Thalassoroseus pseudoceratinae]|uniref:type II and III secretion system protein family protein n=1 Tax=Thalassoroseus pseudoceratinae TaxID=2713176 RepID=UPI001F10A010|nr:pilus assembly protein N-terminal domain-containing protein [Thalassoroseus pseudoceratinae]
MRGLRDWNTVGSNGTMGWCNMRRLGKRLLLASLWGPAALGSAVWAQGPNSSAPYDPVMGPPGIYQQTDAGGPQMAPPQRHMTAPQPLIIGPAPDSRQFGTSPIQQAPGAPIQLTQSQAAPEKPLPPEIAAMPKPQEELEIINHRSQLIVTRKRVSKIAVADPSVIDVVQYSPTELSVIGTERGKTNLMFWFEGEQNPLIYEVTVIRDPDIEDQKRIDYGRLERKLQILFPDSKVYLIPLSYKILVKGQARNAEEAARILQIIRGEVINQEGFLNGPQPVGALGGGVGAGFGNDNYLGLNGNFGTDRLSSLIVNMLEVPGEQQVMLRVRIAELSRSQLRRMGIDLNYIFNNAAHAVTSTVAGTPANLSGIFSNGEVSVLLNWLESNGTAKVLSEPVLTVLSGHSASFLSGAEFAVPTIVGIGGAAGQTTSFRGFGTSVIVTPTVVDRDLIRMRIVPEFSQANQGLAVGGIPGLNSRRVQTTVELREGQTIALAGLILNETNTEVSRIPFLGEIPYIGAKLFAAKQASQDETELLVLVTPEIVRPMDADEVPPVPGYDVTWPSRWELCELGMTEGVPDTGVYQVPPLGTDSNHGINVPYRLYNPTPAAAQYSPVPTNSYGAQPQGAPSMNNGPAYPTQPTYPSQPGYPSNPNAPMGLSPNMPPAPGAAANNHPGGNIVPTGYETEAKKTGGLWGRLRGR